MNDKQQLKSLRGTCQLLNDIGVLAEYPRLEDALVEAIQKLTKQVEGYSQKYGIEESLQQLCDDMWIVQVSIEAVGNFTAVATKDEASHRVVGDTLSWVLECLVKKALPLHWAKTQAEKK